MSNPHPDRPSRPLFPVTWTQGGLGRLLVLVGTIGLFSVAAPPLAAQDGQSGAEDPPIADPQEGAETGEATPPAEALEGGQEEALEAPEEGAALEEELPEEIDEVVEAEEAEEVAAADEPAVPIHGYLRTRYRGRFFPGESDNDLSQNLDLDIGDPARNPFTFHFSGSAILSVDDTANRGDPDFNINDTYDSSLRGRLFEAYADVHRIDELETLRVGRQMLHATPEFVWFDGALVETAPTKEKRFSVGAYGGIPVHEFESSPAGDLLVGGFAQARPYKGTRVRLDYLHLEDENFLSDHNNDLVSFELWQSVQRLSLWGSYSLLDGDSRDYQVRGTYLDPGHDLTLQVAFYQLLETQRDLAFELDPFLDSLLEFFPYYQARLLASKAFAERFSLQGGVDVRRVSDDNDVGQYNRDFERVYCTALLEDVPVDDFELGLTVESWNGDGSGIQTWGLNLEKQVSDGTQASLGTYYSLYKFDLLLDTERERVRTYYIKLDHKLSKSTSCDLEYDFEDDELDDSHTLRLGVSWRF